MNKEKFNPWNWFSHEDKDNQWMTQAKEQSKESMEYLQKELDKLKQGISKTDLYFPYLSLPANSRSKFRPKADIIENDNHYKIIVDVPGVKEEDIDLEANENVLKIKGEKKQEIDEEKEDYHCLERYYGKFQRVISLPEDIDSSKIEAEYNNGLITLTIPRKESLSKNSKKIKLKKAA